MSNSNQATVIIFYENDDVAKWRNVSSLWACQKWLNNPPGGRRFKAWKYFNVYRHGVYERRVYPNTPL